MITKALGNKTLSLLKYIIHCRIFYYELQFWSLILHELRLQYLHIRSLARGHTRNNNIQNVKTGFGRYIPTRESD